MASDSLVASIVDGSLYESGKQQVYKDLADMTYGASNAKLAAQDRNVSLQQDILAKQTDIKTQQALSRSGVPTNTDGSVDYRTLAGMIGPTNPKLGIEYSKEADNQDKIKETARKDDMKAQIDGIKAMSDDMAMVSDQDSLDAFLAKATALKYPLPPNFPKVYNDQTKGAIGKAAGVYTGALKSMDTQYKQEQIKTLQSDQRLKAAEANRQQAASNLDRDKDSRLRSGLPENPTADKNGGIYKDQLKQQLGLSDEHAGKFSEKEAGLLLDDANSLGEIQTTRNYVNENKEKLRLIDKSYAKWKNSFRNMLPRSDLSVSAFFDSGSNDLDDDTVAFGKNLVVASTNIGKRLSGTNRIPISDQRIAQKLVEGAAVTPDALVKILDDSIATMTKNAQVKYGVENFDKRAQPVDLGAVYGKRNRSNTVPDAPPDPSQRKSNTVYNTPKGPLTWTGTGWVK